jgi:hypothetical protein
MRMTILVCLTIAFQPRRLTIAQPASAAKAGYPASDAPPVLADADGLSDSATSRQLDTSFQR